MVTSVDIAAMDRLYDPSAPLDATIANGLLAVVYEAMFDGQWTQWRTNAGRYVYPGVSADGTALTLGVTIDHEDGVQVTMTASIPLLYMRRVGHVKGSKHVRDTILSLIAKANRIDN
jgi:phosphate-selective porin